LVLGIEQVIKGNDNDDDLSFLDEKERKKVISKRLVDA
jgi:hypothetical protein